MVFISHYAHRYGIMAGKIAGVKRIIATYKNMFPFQFRLKTYLLDTFIFTLTDVWVVSSQGMKQYCQRKFYIDNSKFRIIPHGVDFVEIQKNINV